MKPPPQRRERPETHSSLTPRQDPARRLLRHHQRGAVGVAAGDGGHGARVHHAQTRHAAHAQVAVQHGQRVVGAAHLGGAHGVEDGAGDVAGQASQFFIGLELHAGLEFFGLVAGQRRLRHDAAGHAQAVGGHLAVFGGAEVVGRNGGRVLRARAGDVDMAPAGGVEVADARGEGRETVQRLAKGVQAERLHVVFKVGVWLRRVAPGEGAELAGRHAHRAAALERVFEADAGLAPERVGQGVERFAALHLVDLSLIHI